jgi:hypothetical protein
MRHLACLGATIALASPVGAQRALTATAELTVQHNSGTVSGNTGAEMTAWARPQGER